MLQVYNRLQLPPFGDSLPCFCICTASLQTWWRVVGLAFMVVVLVVVVVVAGCAKIK
jgi:hypothetical protein